MYKNCVFIYKMKKQNEQDILNKIQSISLLSMVDIPVAIKFFFNNDVEKLVKYMENEKNEGRGQNVMSVPGSNYSNESKYFFRIFKR